MNLAGKVIAIPTGEGWGVAKVIFQSRIVKNTILIKLYDASFPDLDRIASSPVSWPYKLYFTSRDGVKLDRWKVLFDDSVSDEERLLVKFTSGGEVFAEDTHVGKASDEQLTTLPKMLIHGYRLIEKYAGRTAPA